MRHFFLLLVLAGCVAKKEHVQVEEAQPTPGVTYEGAMERGSWGDRVVDMYADSAHSTICYIYRGYGISCVPLKESK